MNVLILVMVFGVTAFSTYLAMVPSPQTNLVRQRAMAIRKPGLARRANGKLVDEEMELPFTQRVLGPALGKVFALIQRVMPSQVQAGIQLKLIQAGNPVGATQYLGLKTLAAAGMSVAGLLLSTPFLGDQPLAGGGVMLVLLGLGWQVPDFGLSRMATSRRRLIEKALPDVLDLLSVSVEAGLGLDGAIQKVGEKFPEPTSGEFRELLKAVRLGTPRADALRSLADRTALPDMRTFAAAVIQAEQLGVSVSRVLRVQSEALRVRRKQRIEEKAMALPLKMLFPLIIFIFPTIFIVVLGPVVINFMQIMAK